MKLKGLKLMVVAAMLIAIAPACNDKDAEKRIAELENRLAEVESTRGNSTPADRPIPSPNTATQKPEGPLPSFEFSETDHDFGNIKEGEVVEHVFKFKNTGDAPLIIQSASGSCGCTIPTWPKEPIGIGETAEITAQFNSKGRLGKQNKSITITANTWPRTTKLSIKAEVAKAN